MSYAITLPTATCSFQITEAGKTPVLTLSLPRNLDATEAPETRHLEFEELTKAHSELAALIEEFQKLIADWRTGTWSIEIQ